MAVLYRKHLTCVIEPSLSNWTVTLFVDFAEMTPQEFEKDDDSNGHIDYIVATAVSRSHRLFSSNCGK